MTTKMLKALVVEDQELFRQAAADELTFFGFATVTAKDGSEGLQIARSSHLDLILSDIKMPNGDGKWLLSELRKTMKVSPPFVFMTGFADLAPQDAYEMGADGFLGKPLNHDKLVALLTKICQPLQSRWTEQPKQSPGHQISMSFSGWDTEETQSKVALGRGGIFLAEENASIKLGDLISFDIKFADGPLKRLEGMGTVVWKRDRNNSCSAGYGIAFTYISPSSLPTLLAFLGAQEIVAVIPKGRPADGGTRNLNLVV